MVQNNWVRHPDVRPLSYLSQLLYLGTFHPYDSPGQALMDQQTQLTVKINAVVMLVLRSQETDRSVRLIEPLTRYPLED